MECPQCAHENEPKELYCFQCGFKLELSFEQVQDAYQSEIRNEREDTTQRNVFHFLMSGVFLFIVAITFKGCIASDPPTVHNSAPYHSRFETVNEPATFDVEPALPLKLPDHEPVK